MTKLAFPTDDGETISRHFGQAKFFKILSVDDSHAGEPELREKASHQHGEHTHAAGEHPGARMIESISDCQVLISGGMGTPALEKAEAKGLKVILTRLSSIDEALREYVAGSLESDERLVHQHHEHHA